MSKGVGGWGGEPFEFLLCRNPQTVLEVSRVNHCHHPVFAINI